MSSTRTHRLVFGMLFSPAATLERLRHCRTAVAIAPMLLLTIAYSITFCLYYQLVDLAWLRGELTSQLEPIQRVAAQRHLTIAALSGGAVVGAALSTPVFSLLYATYLYMVGQVLDLEQGFGEWLALVNWSSIPSLLFVPVAITTMMVSSDGQVAPGELNTTSVTQLWLHLSESSSWKPLLDSLNLLSIWGYGLLAFGFHLWTRRSLVASLLVPLAPALLILGIWAAVIAARSPT